MNTLAMRKQQSMEITIMPEKIIKNDEGRVSQEEPVLSNLGRLYHYMMEMAAISI